MKPAVSCYRYGSSRRPKEGLRIGSARQAPSGVKRQDWQRRGYLDLWLPLVAPTFDLVSVFRHGKISFPVFARRYTSQMKAPESRQAIELLATLSLVVPISVGCYCEDETRCHRSLLRALILKEAKSKAEMLISGQKGALPEERERFASPVCLAFESES